ncbi:MAG: hypothetical protein JKY09_02315 [Crocinitomicaceae bacterium]|nr:hypothetical protein [Crocinitomicaceae bacterium]
MAKAITIKLKSIMEQETQHGMPSDKIFANTEINRFGLIPNKHQNAPY